jgi:hypothetical protein
VAQAAAPAPPGFLRNENRSAGARPAIVINRMGQNAGNATAVLHDVKQNHYYSKLRIVGGRDVAHYLYWSWTTHCFQGY